MIDTGAMTQKVLDALGNASLLVGDGVAPDTGGWITGSPNVDGFLAYTTVGFDGGTPAMPDVTTSTDWELTFSLRHFGGSRAQCDFQAKAARTAVTAVRHAVVGDYTIIGVRWASLGPMSRNDQVDPPYWSAYDYVVLMCSD